MKTFSPSTESHGVALIIVLAALVLLSALVVAFFSSVTTDGAASRTYAVGLESKKLADEALNVVAAQIKDATTQASTTWISQPGLLRTFDTNGNLATGYKLYSSESMRDADGSFNPATDDAPPADWYAQQGIFTDLNSPIYTPDSAGSVLIDGINHRAIYPIVDPTAGYDPTNEPDGVHGFSIQGAPLETGSLVNPAPMPVRWLYMLRNGSMVAGTTSTPGVINIPGANKDNPVVGRIAFWTDDETCKVNVNTAVGDVWQSTEPGSFIDIPRANGTFEKDLASKQPVSKEFQRYPGHPATTYLSAVFPFLNREQLGEVAPRVQSGGSKGGSTSSTTPITIDKDRLYASGDELTYTRTYSSGSVIERLTQEQSIPKLTPQRVEGAGFFITANSRAPEVNLFNRPRVTIWPEAATQADATTGTTIYGARTTFDKAIAFCSTVGGSPFYFVRNNSWSPTEDYLNFPRNQQLYAYLKNLTGDAAYAKKIPGFGGNFANKYGVDRDQILTQIFDYIRSTNLSDTNLPNANRFTEGPSKTGPTPTILNSKPGSGQVIPIEINTGGVTTRGFGRVSTIHSPTLFFYATHYKPNVPRDPQNWGGVFSVQAVLLIPSFSVSHGVMRLIPDLVYEVAGLDKLTLDGIPMGFPAIGRVNYNAYSPFHERAWGAMEGPSNLFWRSQAEGGGSKPLGTAAGEYPFASSIITFPAKKNVNPCYDPFRGVNTFGSYMRLASTGDLTLKVYPRDRLTNAVSATPIHTFTIGIPTTANIPTPRPYKSALPASPPPPTDYYISWSSASRAFSSNTMFNNENNPTRAFEPLTGDMRLIAGMSVVPKAAYREDRDYDIRKLYAHAFRCGNMLDYWVGTPGLLVSGAAYPRGINSGTTSVNPFVPSFVTAATLLDTAGNQAPGDWDTGMANVADGPYINKPDEGGEVGSGTRFAYYDNEAVPLAEPSLFSPNRQVPSAVIFGSLPTGVKASEAALNNNNLADVRPWQTLVFCPNPASNNVTPGQLRRVHPGQASPPDHLLLDLFTMPVVEPYPISEPFSTAGKINLNYQIAPFSYITRTTGLQAVLRSTRVSAIPFSDANKYKGGASIPAGTKYRHEIDLTETLKGFEDRFANNRPFISASEICDMFLVPSGVGATISNIGTWWENYSLTGDNLREKPYADIYGRLTTKSNTYTVHVRAESLQKRPNTPPGEWIEGKDVVTGEYRGSYTLERFLNPNMTTYNEADPLTDYKFRVIDSKKFAP